MPSDRNDYDAHDDAAYRQKFTDREWEIGKAMARAMAEQPMVQGPNGEPLLPGDPLYKRALAGEFDAPASRARHAR